MDWRSCVQSPSSTAKIDAWLFNVLVLQTWFNLQSKETRNSIGTANFKGSMLDLFFFSINKTCRLNSRRCHCNIIYWFPFEMFAFTVPLAEDVLCDWAHPDCSVARERAPYLPLGATRSCVHISSWAVTHSRGERVLSWGQHLCSPAKKARRALRGQAAVQHSTLCVASTQAKRWAGKKTIKRILYVCCLVAALCLFHRIFSKFSREKALERKLYFDYTTSLWT